MIKRYIETGEITGTQGLKGEVRVQPWCDTPDFLCGFGTLYLDDKGEQPIKIEKARPHGGMAVMKISGVDDVDGAARFRGRVLYIDREDASLRDNSFFISDLIDCRVIDADSGKEYGTVCEVSSTGANDVWHVRSAQGREYLLPAIPDIVIATDLAGGIVTVRPIPGIFDDEN